MCFVTVRTLEAYATIQHSSTVHAALTTYVRRGHLRTLHAYVTTRVYVRSTTYYYYVVVLRYYCNKPLRGLLPTGPKVL